MKLDCEIAPGAWLRSEAEQKREADAASNEQDCAPNGKPRLLVISSDDAAEQADAQANKSYDTAQHTNEDDPIDAHTFDHASIRVRASQMTPRPLRAMRARPVAATGLKSARR